MLPDELFLFAISLTLRNSELNDMQAENQKRIERKIDEIMERISRIEEIEERLVR